MSKELVVSVSALQNFLTYPAIDYFGRVAHLPRTTDYARLCGKEVHALTEYLEQPTKTPRRFYYQDLNAATGQWWRRWHRATEEAEAKSLLMHVDKKAEGEFGGIGKKCLETYWYMYEKQPRPQEVEKKYYGTTQNGIKIVGVLDRLQSVPLEYIMQKRPDLVKNGELIDGYDPVIIEDYKTGWDGFDNEAFARLDTMQQVRRQFSLHQDYQFTAYTWLYWLNHDRRLPVGCEQVLLRTGNRFFTHRTPEDFDDFFHAVRNYVIARNNEAFSKNPGSHCARCDFIAPCRGCRPFMISWPGKVIYDERAHGYEIVPNLITQNPNKQPRLKGLKIPREEGIPPSTIKPVQITFLLFNEPWADPTLKEEKIEA